MIDEKQLEEQKRQRCADPQLWWTVIQQTIAWVDSQQTIPRASKEGCLLRQRKFDNRHSGQSE